MSPRPRDPEQVDGAFAEAMERKERESPWMPNLHPDARARFAQACRQEAEHREWFGPWGGREGVREVVACPACSERVSFMALKLAALVTPGEHGEVECLDCEMVFTVDYVADKAADEGGYGWWPGIHATAFGLIRESVRRFVEDADERAADALSRDIALNDLTREILDELYEADCLPGPEPEDGPAPAQERDPEPPEPLETRLVNLLTQVRKELDRRLDEIEDRFQDKLNILDDDCAHREHESRERDATLRARIERLIDGDGLSAAQENALEQYRKVVRIVQGRMALHDAFDPASVAAHLQNLLRRKDKRIRRLEKDQGRLQHRTTDTGVVVPVYDANDEVVEREFPAGLWNLTDEEWARVRRFMVATCDLSDGRDADG